MTGILWQVVWEKDLQPGSDGSSTILTVGTGLLRLSSACEGWMRWGGRSACVPSSTSTGASKIVYLMDLLESAFAPILSSCEFSKGMFSNAETSEGKSCKTPTVACLTFFQVSHPVLLHFSPVHQEARWIVPPVYMRSAIFSQQRTTKNILTVSLHRRTLGYLISIRCTDLQ